MDDIGWQFTAILTQVTVSSRSYLRKILSFKQKRQHTQKENGTA